MKEPLTNGETRRFVRFLFEEWKSGKYAKITIIYNHYISAIAYQSVARTFLPILPDDIISFLEAVKQTPHHFTASQEHTIEPDIQTLVDMTIPLVLNAQFHEVLLEARASEYSARMIAMKNASDSANKKVGHLTLVYNKARQAGITKEVSEIVSGVESMKE